MFAKRALLWGLPAWWTPNWGHRVAPVLGSFSPLGVTQARFLDSPCPGRPHFGVHLADPELGPLIQNVLRVGPPGGPSFELVFRPLGISRCFLYRRVRGGPIRGSASRTPNWVRRYEPIVVGSPCGQLFNPFSFPEYVQGAGGRMCRDRSCWGVERVPASFCPLEPIGSNRCGWTLLPPEHAHAGHAQGYVRGYVQGTCRACMGYVRCPRSFPRRHLVAHPCSKWARRQRAGGL